MKTYIITILFVLIIAACCKDKVAAPDAVSGFQKDDFPISVGNWWRYQVIDAMQQTTDTLTLKVVDFDLSQSTFTCQIIQHNQIVDTGYFIISSNRIEYKGINQNYSYFGNFTLTVPFQVGSSWIGDNPKDTVSVLSKVESFEINGNVYTPIYNLKRIYNLLGGYRLIQDFIVLPKVGIVYQSLDIADGFPLQKQGFQLIDFEVQ